MVIADRINMQLTCPKAVINAFSVYEEEMCSADVAEILRKEVKAILTERKEATPKGNLSG
jgi:hypothetical protein